ncbi:MAG: hypothetical protein JWO97_1789, partial [Acidobacteria bacterium]|nr:hypothetical protein [Acidobacteriota bacterium]
MKRLLFTLAILLTATIASAASVAKPIVTENNASCEIGNYPAATLLLPYFEVDFRAPST